MTVPPALVDSPEHPGATPLRRKLRAGITIVLLLGLLSGWATRTDWLPGIASSLNVGESARKTSAVMILPGSETTRPFVAVGLVQAGYADRVLVPETWVTPDVRSGLIPSTGEITRLVLIRRGIPEEKIVSLGGQSDSTFGDASALRLYFEQQGECDVTIVTNAYHTRRARWVFDRVLPESSDRLYFFSAPDDFHAERWWLSRRGRQAVLGEWMKLGFYFVYYGRGWVWGLLVGGVVVGVRRAFRR